MGSRANAKKLIVTETVYNMVMKCIAEHPKMTAEQATEIWMKSLGYHYGGPPAMSTPDAVRRAIAEVLG